MGVLDELKICWLGSTKGVDLKDTDFAFATRQWGHHNEKNLPMTVRFRYAETAERVKIAAEEAGILKRRRPVEVGKYRIPKNEEDDLIVTNRAKDRPKTWIRLSVPEKERRNRKAIIDSRNTADYLAGKKVNQWMKRRRLGWSREEDNVITKLAKEVKENEEREKVVVQNGTEENGTGNGNTK